MGKISMPPDVDDIDAFKAKRSKAEPTIPIRQAEATEDKLLSVKLVKRAAKRANQVPSRNRLEDFDLVFTYQEKQ